MPAPSVLATAPEVIEVKTHYWGQRGLPGGSEASNLGRVRQALSFRGPGDQGVGGCSGPLLGSLPCQQGRGGGVVG